MAYQPIRPLLGGHLSEITSGVTAITLPTAGPEYVVLVTRFITPNPTADFAIQTEAVSLMSTSKKQFEWRFLANAIVNGDPLVFTQLDVLSVLEGAMGNGTQETSNGFPFGLGGFVPPDNERGLPKDLLPSEQLPFIVPKFAIGYLVARGLSNNTTLVARASFRELELDAAGVPL